MGESARATFQPARKIRRSIEIGERREPNDLTPCKPKRAFEIAPGGAMAPAGRAGKRRDRSRHRNQVEPAVWAGAEDDPIGVFSEQLDRLLEVTWAKTRHIGCRDEKERRFAGESEVDGALQAHPKGRALLGQMLNFPSIDRRQRARERKRTPGVATRVERGLK